MGRVAPVIGRCLRVAVPQGSQFKGDGPNPVGDLVLTAQAVGDCRERRLTLEGKTIVAPLRGHFSTEPQRSR
jgi:hypothetical protein